MAKIYYEYDISFRQRLTKLCIKDMNENDITGLILGGFKGFDNFSIEELVHSVMDRYEIHNEDDMHDITVKLLNIMGE